MKKLSRGCSYPAYHMYKCASEWWTAAINCHWLPCIIIIMASLNNLNGVTCLIGLFSWYTPLLLRPLFFLALHRMSALTLFARYSDELKAWLSTPVSLDSGSSGGSGGTVSIEAWHGCSSGQLGLSLGGYPVTITPPSDTADVRNNSTSFFLMFCLLSSFFLLHTHLHTEF